MPPIVLILSLDPIKPVSSMNLPVLNSKGFDM